MKTPHTIQITQSDYNKLRDLLQHTAALGSAEKSYREALSHELLRACIMPSSAISADVITLHSRARLIDLDSGETLEFTIVLPEEVDIDSGHISILAPLGTAMLGYSQGDTFEWTVPAGTSRFRVDEILYQPEAVGHTA